MILMVVLHAAIIYILLKLIVKVERTNFLIEASLVGEPKSKGEVKDEPTT